MMITECLNPQCGRELRYLRDGRVVRVVRGKDENAVVEHFWLCGPCYSTHDFRFAADGSVSVMARNQAALKAELESWLDSTLVA